MSQPERDGRTRAFAVLARAAPFALLTALLGCGDETLPTAGPVTFHRDIEPILQRSCQRCHYPGRIAPFSLVKFVDAQTAAGAMAAHTRDRSMPPWGAVATDECQPRLPWKNDQRLSELEITMFEQWNAAGAPEGNPADAPNPIVPESPDLADVDLTVEPFAPFTPTGEADAFRCFVLDPKLTEDRYVNAARIVVGDPAVAHHAIVFVDPESKSRAKMDADHGYTCLDSADIPKALPLATWAPDGFHEEYPPDVGFLVPAGAKLVLQVHYHLTGKTARPDPNKVELRFARTTPKYLARYASVGNDDYRKPDGDGLQPGPDDDGTVKFHIPAGARAHTETMRTTIPSDFPPGLRLYGLTPHMHLVGTDIKVGLERAHPPSGEPAQECLIQEPRWNFSWQRTYDFDVPLAALPTLSPGDVVTTRCTYDNTMDNAILAQQLLAAKMPGPVDVRLGETVMDEMCFGALVLLQENPSP